MNNSKVIINKQFIIAMTQCNAYDRWLSNIKTQTNIHNDWSKDTLVTIMVESFKWNETPEGGEYWCKIHSYLIQYAKSNS